MNPEPLFTADDLSPEFWNLIAIARRDRDHFHELVKDMERDEMVQFCRDYDRAASELYAECFLEHVDPDLSEDDIHDLSFWVVAQGKEHYSHVLDNPEAMPYQVDSDDPMIRVFGDVVRAYYERFKESLQL